MVLILGQLVLYVRYNNARHSKIRNCYIEHSHKNYHPHLLKLYQPLCYICHNNLTVQCRHSSHSTFHFY